MKTSSKLQHGLLRTTPSSLQTSSKQTPVFSQTLINVQSTANKGKNAELNSDSTLTGLAGDIKKDW